MSHSGILPRMAVKPAERTLQWKSVPVSSLIPYVNNARTHSKEQVSQIAASIKEFGFLNPVIIDESNGIIAGHGRVLAAQLLGLGEVPCVEAAWLTDAQRKAYIIADNKLALNAGWDEELLRLEIEGLQALGVDLALTGFSDSELNKLMAEGKSGLTDPDDVPALEEIAVAQQGEVWILGRHRLACGDCTDAETVKRCMNGIVPMIMVTDPPYGVEYDPTWRERAGVNKAGAYAKGAVLNDDKADWSAAWALFPGVVAYVWHAALHRITVENSLAANDFNVRSEIIWAKSRFALSRGDYHWQHEPCLYAVKKNAGKTWAGDRSQSTLWQIDHARNDTGHGTQKPVECMRRPMMNSSSIGQAVYEPFSGSGTTIIAAEMSGRQCLAVELNPLYVDMAVKRWQLFTGLEATLEGDGRTFSAVTADRTAPKVPEKPQKAKPKADGAPNGKTPSRKKRAT